MNKLKGFTLIELMISMSLLTGIMLLATWSFSIFVDKWDGQLGKFEQSVSLSKDKALLVNLLSGIVPFVFNKNDKAVYYFEGTSTELKAISTSSIFFPETTVVFRLIINTEVNGTKTLLLQEAPLTVLKDESHSAYTHEKVLMQGASSLRFEYFGWQNIQQKIENENLLNSAKSIKPQWFQRFFGYDALLLPVSVKVIWDDSEFEINLVNDQGQWLTVINSSGAANE